MNMKKLLIPLMILSICLFTTSAFAGNFRHGARDQADSDFRIAEKSYRKAIKNYGQSLSGLPDKEKASACKKINSALYTNRHNMIAEDMFRQNKVKGQINKLERYGNEMGCPPKD